MSTGAFLFFLALVTIGEIPGLLLMQFDVVVAGVAAVASGIAGVAAVASGIAGVAAAASCIAGVAAAASCIAGVEAVACCC